jgi:soluble lytic murein transglycosylase-like protein
MRTLVAVLAGVGGVLLPPPQGFKVGWPGVVPVAQVTQRVMARAFQRHGAPAPRARQVAQVVYAEAERQRVDPLLVTAIITVENPTLTRRATSTEGAQGLMQVMPFWRRSFRSCGANLRDDRTNICMGIRVFKAHLASAKGSVRRSLLGYSGCKTTPGCERYPGVVLRRHATLRVALAEGR